MIIGVGVDLVEDSNFQKRLERSPSLLVSLLRLSHDLQVIPSTSNIRVNPRSNLDELQRAKSNLVTIEALFKAIPKNLRPEIRNLKIYRDFDGKPHLVYLGNNQVILKKLQFHLSISHDSGITIGIVIVESLV